MEQNQKTRGIIYLEEYFCLLKAKVNTVSDLVDRRGNLGDSFKSKIGHYHFRNFREGLCICRNLGGRTVKFTLYVNGNDESTMSHPY